MNTQILINKGVHRLTPCNYLALLTIRNQQAAGSNPIAGSSKIKGFS